MRTRHAITVIVFSLYGQWIYAQPIPGNGPLNGFEPPNDPIAQALDSDRDGQLSQDEIEKAPDALLKLDGNKDGVLALDELLPTFPGRQGGFGGGPGGGMGPNQPNIELADKHDKDGNGYLDASERQSALKELESLNANNRRGPRGPRGAGAQQENQVPRLLPPK